MEQTDLLLYAIEVLERLSVPYMLVGSYASTVYGEPRFTQDIDIVLELESRLVSEFCQAFPAPEFYLNEQAVHEAVTSRFNVLHPTSGNKIDFILPRTDDWGRAQMQRRQRVLLLPDREGVVAMPEDVIIGKMICFAEGGSEKHLRDITGILCISGDAVDREDKRMWATRLGLTNVWEAIEGSLRNQP